MKAILVPLKNPANAKTRLSALLTPEQRVELVLAMFQDVATALGGTSGADRVFIATNYEPAIKIAEGYGFEVYREQEQISESHSVDEASRWLRSRGFDLVLRLPADIPLVQAADIDALLTAQLSSPGTLMVPSREGTGTNAISRTPPDLFPSHFGPNSLSLHKEEAARRGAQVVIHPNERIGLDIDEPGDIRELLERRADTHTTCIVRGWGLASTLARSGQDSNRI